MSVSGPYRFGVVTLFPELFQHFSEVGVIGRACQQGIIDLQFQNPRTFTQDRYQTVDDRPYGGGPGMVMLAEPLAQATDALKIALGSQAPVCYLSPQGEKLTHSLVQELVEQPSLILICGRYEGVDERFIEAYVDRQISIGDYVLSGGELPAQVIIDAVARQLPGVLGHEASAAQDSFAQGLLDCPHYTRPEVWREHAVPKVLLSGHHEKIAKWRLRQSQERTGKLRPDLF